jgi:hypothetical protein
MAKGINVQIAGIKALRNRLSKLTNDTVLLEALRLRLADVWARGAQQFVLVAARELATKGKGTGFVDTGMTAATFWALSKKLNEDPYDLKAAVNLIEAKIASPPRGQRKGVPTFPAGARRSGFQNVEEGKKLGERAYIFRVPIQGGKQFVFKFSFQTVSWQMAFWDKGLDSITNGIVAFESRVAREFEQQARLVLDAHFKGKTLPKQGIFT